MVWHIRLLSPPQIALSSSHVLKISTALTLTTDLNDTFYPASTKLSVQLWQKQGDQHSQCFDEAIGTAELKSENRAVGWRKVGDPEIVGWKAGARIVKANFTRHVRREKRKRVGGRQTSKERGKISELVTEKFSQSGESLKENDDNRQLEELDEGGSAATANDFVLHFAIAAPGPSSNQSKHSWRDLPKHGIGELQLGCLLPIPEVLDVWSDDLQLGGDKVDCEGEHARGNRRWVQRRFAFNTDKTRGKSNFHPRQGQKAYRGIEKQTNQEHNGDEESERPQPLLIYEELGESIARHVWDAGIVLSFYMQSLLDVHPIGGAYEYPNANPELAALIHNSRERGSPINAIELGSGTGVAGLTLSRILPQNSFILLTDLLAAQELLWANKKSNARLNPGVKVEVCVLDWTEPIPNDVRGIRWDLVVITDCTYNVDSSPALAKILVDLVEGEGSPEKNKQGQNDALVVVAMKVRHASEAIFFDLMAEKGFTQTERKSVLLPDQHRFDAGLDAEEIDLYGFKLFRGNRID